MEYNPEENKSESLIPQLNFDSLVMHSGNQLAWAAGRQLCESLGGAASSFGTLFIHGRVDQGKTHLLHAIGNAATNQNVLYLPCQTLARKLLEAQSRGPSGLVEHWVGSHDLVLLDNFDFVTNKQSVQTALLTIMDRLWAHQGQLAAAGLTEPRGVTGLDQRLQARFEAGLIAPITPPDDDGLIQILSSYIPSRTRGIEISALGELIAPDRRNIPELISLLRKAVLIFRASNVSFRRAIEMVIGGERFQDGSSRR